MRFLIVTEKLTSIREHADGGSMLVRTLLRELGSDADVMQFGDCGAERPAFRFDYPVQNRCRFTRRLTNAPFIAERVLAVAAAYTDIVFVHISMQFTIGNSLPLGVRAWTFPMLLGTSYIRSGEAVPKEYLDRERDVIRSTHRIITPSVTERSELAEHYAADSSKIRVVPRGISAQTAPARPAPVGDAVHLCTIGSIKPQKNTLESVDILARVRASRPGSTLRIVGPTQNQRYRADVESLISLLGLESAVEFTGAVAPSSLAEAVGGSHLSLCPSYRETFGRSTFESLAMGLPTVFRSGGGAADDLLAGSPYAGFYSHICDAPTVIASMLEQWSIRSRIGREIGFLYDDAFLGRLLAAELRRDEAMVIADFDGTIFHKSDPARTLACSDAFARYAVRTVCSARPIEAIQRELHRLGITADWIIGSSGGVATDSRGREIWRMGLGEARAHSMLARVPNARLVLHDNMALQVAIEGRHEPDALDLRSERYVDHSHILPWGVSKLHAIVRLLRTINWTGRVRVFGDGPADQAALAFFGGLRLVKQGSDVGIGETRELFHDFD